MTKMSLQISSDSSSTSFEWGEYLTKTNGRPAEPKCFKQSLVPPQNHFEVDTLLEAEDQRSAALDIQTTPSYTAVDQNKSRAGSGLGGSLTAAAGLGVGGAGRRSSLLSNHPVGTVRRFRAAAFSLAKVVEVWGSRLRIRLVGTDDRNDCWFLVDSDQIRPYPSGNALQPPFGYMHNHLVWNRTLKKATEGTKFADPSWFIEPPPDPADNYFRVGDKLEAVDRRNTQLICPATVGAVNGQHILVSFDGWSGAFDYWTRFDSRELFPVGWCKLADYPLQAPGPNALRSPTSHSTPGPPSKAMLAPPAASNGVFPLDISSVGETPARLRPKKPKTRAKPGPKSTNTPVLSLSIAHSRARRVPRLTRKRRRKPPRLLSADSERISTHSDRPLALAISSAWTTDGPLSKPGSDTLHPHTESADSSMRSLCSPPPPIIHPATMDDDVDGDDESLLNITGSSLSDQPPPAIEVAVTTTTTTSSSSASLLTTTHLPDSSLSSTSRGRRTSSSSDCVVRLQAKSPPVLLGSGADHLVKPELKSWQVVTTEPRSKSPKKKFKLLKKHRNHSGDLGEASAVGLKKKFKFVNSTSDSSSRKVDDFPLGQIDRNLKPGPLTIDTTEDHLKPERHDAFSTGEYAAAIALADTREKSKLASLAAAHHYPHDYFPSHHEAVLHAQKISSYTAAHCPSEFNSISLESRDDARAHTPTATVCAVSQQHAADTGAPGATNWYTSTKLDYYPGTKVAEVYSGSQVPDDYLDAQSLAPHVSSSTVSPSSLDLGPCPLPNPLHWTIDEVYHYIATRDSSLLEVAQKFKHHEIDGQALLLLTMEALRNYLKIKLGPALKVDHLISRLKRGVL